MIAKRISIQEAVLKLTEFITAQEARDSIVKLLSEGMIESEAARWHDIGGTLSAQYRHLLFPSEGGEPDVDAAAKLINYHYNSDEKYHPENFRSNDEVWRSFWHNGHSHDSRKWADYKSDFIFADWRLSSFSKLGCSVASYLGDESSALDCGYCRAVGVSLDLEQLLLFFPEINPTVSEPARSSLTKYDWLGAFAHVAARCRYDDVIADVNARGAKAEIVEILKDWFGANQPNIPGNSVLKEKADIVLKELIKQFGRSG
jgi:hypothetical protein